MLGKITIFGQLFELAGGELCLLLKLVDELSPLLQLAHKVPGVGKVEHYYKDCLFEELLLS